MLTLKYLYSMIFTVTYNDIPARHNSYAFQAFELSVTRAPRAESSEEVAVRVEDLDPVVARVSHNDVTLVVYSYTSVEELYNCKDVVHTWGPNEVKLVYVLSWDIMLRALSVFNVKNSIYFIDHDIPTLCVTRKRDYMDLYWLDLA